MEILRDRRKGLEFAYIYYENPQNIPYYEINADILVIYQSPTIFEYGYHKSFWTLEHDLTKNSDDLFQCIGKNCRYKINRADKKDHLTLSIIDNPNLESITSFVSFYNQFADDKGTSYCDNESLKQLQNHNMLAIATVQNSDDETLCSHALITNRYKVRLLHSASLFRSQFKNETALLARANRYLHWKELLFFKEKNYQIYDFGGYAYNTDEPSLIGINNFKQSFGGRLVEQYHLMIPLSWKGKIGCYYLKSKWK